MTNKPIHKSANELLKQYVSRCGSWSGTWCGGRCGCSVIFVRVNRVCQVSSSIMIVVVAFVIFVTKCKRLKMEKTVMICM